MTEKFNDGYYAHCHRTVAWDGKFRVLCGGRYWVRSVDMGRSQVRRFTDRESNEFHTCAGGQSPRLPTYTSPPVQEALPL